MSSSITFPPFGPKLKLPRRASEHPLGDPAAEARVLPQDATARREGEQKVGGDEQRVGASQAEVHAEANFANPTRRAGSTAPVQSESALQNAWEQLERARELLEAEQRYLRDERMSLRALAEKVAQREAALAAREEDFREREARLAAAAQTPPPVEEPESLVRKLTRAPFGVARSVFGGGDK